MANQSKIEWTEATWNPVVGCSLASPGCTNCYAMKMAGRIEAMGHAVYQGLTQKTKAGFVWTGKLALNVKALLEPLRRKKPTMYFVNSMGDLFHEDCPDEWIDRVFAVMALCPQHTFQVLTKRSGRMREYMQGPGARRMLWRQAIPDSHAGSLVKVPLPLPNVWLGVSVEDQARADERIGDLLATPAAVRWLSCEPLLGPVTLTMLHHDGMTNIDCLRGQHGVLQPMRGECAKIDWVVAGGESGPGARPMHPDWARGLRDQCTAAGVPFFFKQWGDWRPDVFSDPVPFDTGKGRAQRFPAFLMKHDGTVHCFLPEGEPAAPVVIKVGKKRAGRLLDGVLHDAFPEVAA